MKSNHQINCLCAVDDYIYAISETNSPQRYSLANKNWQKGAKLPRAKAKLRSFITNDGYHKLSTVVAVVLKSKIYVVHGCEKQECTSEILFFLGWEDKPAVTIVLTQKRMHGSKNHQPAVLVLDPVFS